MQELPTGFEVDPDLSKQMGTTVAVNRQTGKRIRWSGEATAPALGAPRPEYGSGAYETSDGSILRPAKGGSVQVMRGPQIAGAEARTRLKLGLGPTIEAQQNLYKTEEWKPERVGTGKDPSGHNPLDTFRGGLAEWLTPENPNNSVLTRIAKNVGGQDYQDYQQAAKSFEAAFLPILSGAAVMPTEAARMIQASLPQPGDSPKTLAKKATNRAMMINSAAELLGSPKPFPRVGSMDFKSGATTPAAGADMAALRREASEAIRAGAPRDKVVARLRAMGVTDTSGM